MNASENQNNQYIPIPEQYTRRELNALYREIPLKDTTSRTLRKYFCAMANLYGVISLKDAYFIISNQSPSLVTAAEFLAFAEIARHEIEDYFILGEDEIFYDIKSVSPFEREIIDKSLLDDTTDLYLQTKEGQQGKPFFVPAKKQFLLYEDPFYFEPTPERTALHSFLISHFDLDETLANAIFLHILMELRYLDSDLAETLHALAIMGLDFNREQDVHTFIDLYQTIHNTTRMQCNRGYTPKELFLLHPPKNRLPSSVSFGPNMHKAIADGTLNAEELRQGVLSMDIPNEELRQSFLKEITAAEASPEKSQKVGRNELCPCGSGKKFKRCCGQ